MNHQTQPPSNSMQEIAYTFLQQLSDSLENTFDSCDIEYNQGIMNITCENQKVFVLNWHNPSQQIWLASPISGAWTFSYSLQNLSWFCSRKQKDLKSLIMEELCSLVS